MTSATTVSCEGFDNAVNQLRQLSERWDNRLSLKGLVFSEAYSKGALKYLADFDILWGGHSNNYQAVFQRLLNIAVSDGDVEAISFKDKIGYAHNVCYRNKELMFIRDIEIVETPEGVIPSCVWLHCPNQIQNICAGATYFHFLNSTFKAIFAFGYREIDTLDVAIVEANEITGEQVEGAPKVVNGIPNECRKIARNLFTNASDPSMHVGFRVVLNDDSIRLSVKESADFGLKVNDMAVGPFNL